MTNPLHSIPGLGGYVAAKEANEQTTARQLQQASVLQQLHAQMQAQRQGQQDRQRNEALRAAIAALPPEKRTRENVLPLLMQHAGNVKELAGMLPDEPKPLKPPETRQRYDGTRVVQEEFVNGTWREYGRGDRFNPRADAQAKPPSGFRYKQDGSGELEAIPGGPKDTAPKDLAKAKGAVQKANIVIGKVDEALAQTGFFSTGLTGTVLGAVPGTGAYDLEKTIDTIKANLGFSELQAMRDASPTGGALGQVAIQELMMLQSTVASLEKGQSEENLRRGLQQVKTHFENWKKAVAEANPAALDQGGAPGPASPAAFATEAEAQAAAAAGKIKPGDRITVGGKTGTWR